jgi:hypothetical protein
LYPEIENILNKISSEVLFASKMPLNNEDEKGRYADITHFIPGKFKNDRRFDSLIKEFVEKKIDYLKNQIRERT